MVSTNMLKPKTGIPLGKYKIVAWDLDSTGRRLIDEFCHIAGYTPEDQFSQYIMPYKEMEANAMRRHLMKTITAGRYRMLKDLKTGKFLKTKSEFSALNDFLNWLEKIKGDTGLDIILLSYETFKIAPTLLLEALKKYQLLDRFTSLVKGFAIGHDFVKEKCEATFKTYTLRVVSKVLIDREDEVFKASDRAKLSYEVIQHLTTGGEGDAGSNTAMVEALREHSVLVSEELKIIEDLKVLLKRQNSLKPVFGPLMREDNGHRRLAMDIRKLVMAANFDYASLTALWGEGKDKFEEIIISKLSEDTSEDQKKEVCKMLSNHFSRDPQEPQLQRKRYRNSKTQEEKNTASRERTNTINSDPPATPDTTDCNVSISSSGKDTEPVSANNESSCHKPSTTTDVVPDTATPTGVSVSSNEQEQSTTAVHDSKISVASNEEPEKPTTTTTPTNVGKAPTPVMKDSPTQKITSNVSKSPATVKKESPTNKSTLTITPNKTVPTKSPATVKKGSPNSKQSSPSSSPAKLVIKRESPTTAKDSTKAQK